MKAALKDRALGAAFFERGGTVNRPGNDRTPVSGGGAFGASGTTGPAPAGLDEKELVAARAPGMFDRYQGKTDVDQTTNFGSV
jgi:hypothetical protein